MELAELLALLEVVQDCELRLGRAKRQLLSAVRDPRGEDRILQLVLAGAQLDLDEAGFTRLAKPVEALPLVGARAGLRLVQRVQLLPREELAVARDDLGALETSFSPTRTARPSSARSKRYLWSSASNSAGVLTAVTLILDGESTRARSPRDRPGRGRCR